LLFVLFLLERVETYMNEERMDEMLWARWSENWIQKMSDTIDD